MRQNKNECSATQNAIINRANIVVYGNNKHAWQQKTTHSRSEKNPAVPSIRISNGRSLRAMNDRVRYMYMA